MYLDLTEFKEIIFYCFFQQADTESELSFLDLTSKRPQLSSTPHHTNKRLCKQVCAKYMLHQPQ